MWVFLALLIVCLTIIVVFRMYLDLREGDRRHIRLIQNDAQSYDKYKRITQQEALAEITKLVQQQSRQLPSRAAPLPSKQELDAQVGYYLEKDYDNFMREQQRRAKPWD